MRRSKQCRASGGWFPETGSDNEEGLDVAGEWQAGDPEAQREWSQRKSQELEKTQRAQALAIVLGH